MDRLFGGNLPCLSPEIYLRLGVSRLLVWGAVVATGGDYPVLRVPRAWLTWQTLVRAGRLLRGESAAGVLRNGILVQDALTQGRKGLLVAGAVLAWRGRWGPRGRGKLDAFEYPVLRLLARRGRRLLLSAYDLRTLYLALELQSLCLYILAAFRRGSAFSTEAGLKFFILGALSSGILLFGASLVYGALGTTGYEERGRLLAAGVSGTPVEARVTSGAALVTVGLLFKLAAAPFHRWSPDVYEGSPRGSAIFLATVTKVATVGALVRLRGGPFYGLRESLVPVFWGVSAFSRVLAALAALGQRKIKRFLAYSAIGHRGYLLRGLTCGTLEGAQGLLVYRSVYLRRGINVWVSRGGLSWVKGGAAHSPAHSPVHSQSAVYRTDLQGLGHVHPALARSVATGRFSRAGIPPRAGFFAKFRVFGAAREASLYSLALLGVLTSVVGAYYYLRWVKLRYFSPVGADRLVLPLPHATARVVAVTWGLRALGARHPEGILLWTHRRALAWSR